MRIAGLGRQYKLHGVVLFVLQPHAEGVIAHRTIAGHALAAGDPGDHALPGHNQHPMGAVVDVADFAALAVEADRVAFGQGSDVGEHAVDEGADRNQG
ncbi:hypothetical protein D3C73_1463630 [compost metagenome]